MAEAATLAMTIRTPHAVIFDEAIDGARIPTESGLAGIRPRGEPLVAAVEPGLVVLRSGGALRFAATAGGLVETDRQRCTLYTPYAVVGASEEEMLAALAKIKATPSSEILARRQLGELEERIVHELGQRPRTMPQGGGGGDG
ncbi:MAG: hypothetical protein H6710_18205 [Myxococcales bacterium]|nr:hypothetical protein [Myxococcales bacterium]MCB9701267.1 hypothetical protein [Myxococcales bacterium]